MSKKITVESEIAKALFKFSYGKLSLTQAKAKAREVAPKFEASNEMLQHKGINWYAKQIIRALRL